MGPSFQKNGNTGRHMHEGLGWFEAIPRHVLGPAPQEGARHQNYRRGLASPGHLRRPITEEGMKNKDIFARSIGNNSRQNTLRRRSRRR